MLPDTALRRNPADTVARVAAFAGISPEAPPRRRAACAIGAACAGVDVAAATAAASGGVGALSWAALTAQQLDSAIADEYEAFARTGWVIAGDYAPLPPALRADLRDFFRPYNAALQEALGGCNVLQEDAGADNVPLV